MTPILPFLKSLFPQPSHDRVFLVGGTVRDMLLARSSQDIDLVAALSHEELLALGFRVVEPTSAATIYFTHNPQFGNIEITRINSINELESDLLRRDFTVNAMAMELSGTHIDPLGGGADLQGVVLRACSEDSFVLDPLRIFRAFRFEADGWRMAADTEALVRRQDWSAPLATVPVERFSNEMLKALTGSVPERFFQRMIEFNAGKHFLPEIFRMPMIPAGPLQYHPEGDLLTHSIQVLQRLTAESTEPLPRFCALFHDLGKLATNPALYPKHHGHDEAGFTMAAEFCNRLRLPATYRNALAWVNRLHGKLNKWDELRDSTKVKMAEQAIKAGIIRILPLVSAADKGGAPLTAEWDDAVRVAGMNVQELGIHQDVLEKIPAGKRPPFMLQKRADLLRALIKE